MNKVKLVLFCAVLFILSACSSYRSFRLVKVGDRLEQQHEITVTKVDAITKIDQPNSQEFVAELNQQGDEQLSTVSYVQAVKRLVVEKKSKVVRAVKINESKLKQIVAQKTNQPTDNFWMDLIRDFFLFMLVAMVIVVVITAMIVYGNPVVQTIGKTLAITLIIIGFFAFLFS
jgi:hypothetical protein